MPLIRKTLPFVLALATACGGSSDEVPSTAQSTPLPADAPAATPAAASSPEGVAHAFFEAAGADDREGLLALFTEKARESVSSGDSFQVESETLGEYEVGSSTIEAGEAKVPVVAFLDGQEQDMRLLMRRVSSDWRIYAFDVSVGGEGWMTINLETIDDMLQGMVEGMADGLSSSLEGAFDDWSQGGSEEEIALARERFESLRAITPEEHSTAWSVDVHAKDTPALEVVSNLFADHFNGTGVSLDTTRMEAFAQPITMELTGVSRLEALERICEAVGVHPVYPAPNQGGIFSHMAEGMVSAIEGSFPEAEMATAAGTGTEITFEDGPRMYDVAFAGPFLIEVLDLTENPPTTTGSLTLAVRSLGMSPICLAYQTEMMELMTIDAVEGSSGQNLNATSSIRRASTSRVSCATSTRSRASAAGSPCPSRRRSSRRAAPPARTRRSPQARSRSRRRTGTSTRPLRSGATAAPMRSTYVCPLSVRTEHRWVC
jgi:hypothetical protein